MSVLSLSPPRTRPRPRLAGRLEVVIGCAVLALILIAGYLLPIVTGYPSSELVGVPLEAPSPSHPFGTDSFGRDVLVRSFAAVRVDYLIAAVAVGVSAVVGSIVGSFAGATSHRRPAWVVEKLIDAVLSFPFVVLVLCLVLALGTQSSVLGLPGGLVPVLVAFLLTGWAFYARIARSQALSLAQRDFVLAGRLMGYSETRIILRHIFPSVGSITLAYAVGDAISAVAFTASLSLFGAGVQPPTPELGQMMFEGRAYLEIAWWITLFPTVLLIVSGVALSMVGDGCIKRLEDRV